MPLQDRPKTETRPMAVRHTFPVHPLWVAAALIMGWLEAVREGLGSQLERMRLSREMWYNRSR
jgi:hypothetical protein